MLTADRPQLAVKAVQAFRAQTYPAKQLFILNSGCGPVLTESENDKDGVYEPCIIGLSGGLTVGELRNRANEEILRRTDGADIFVHFDDDDYSHPNRIAEQVALLQTSGADCVGYREMLFWREKRGGLVNPRHESFIDQNPDPAGEAWLYSNPDPRYCLGTSLCYWRKTWEQKPFEPTSSGEDQKFWTGLKSVGIFSLVDDDGSRNSGAERNPELALPRMIARIHAGNTSKVYDAAIMQAEARQGGMWKRVPAWDAFTRGIME